MTQKMHPLDRATQLTQLEEGHWQGATSADYANMVGPFGGVVAATLLNAVLSDARAQGHPVSQTVNFCKAISDGDFTMRSALQRSGKYTQHWSLEMLQEGVVCATSSVVMGVRAQVFSHQPETLPEGPGYDDLPVVQVPSPVAWLDRYEFRFIEGAPPASRDQIQAEFTPPKTRVWLRDVPDRQLDYLSLAALCDSFLPRPILVRGSFVPLGTVSLTTHFLATPEEIAAQGTKPVLGIADSSRIHANFNDQSMQMWGSDGTVLASGTQVMWYRQ